MEELEKVGGRGVALTAPLIVRPAGGLNLGHFKSLNDKAPEAPDSLFGEICTAVEAAPLDDSALRAGWRPRRLGRDSGRRAGLPGAYLA